MPTAEIRGAQATAKEALQRGISFHQSGRLEEAIHWYRKTLKVQPENSRALSNMGGALQTQGKIDEAVACYHKAISIKPDYAEAHNNLGLALMEQGKIDEAVAC